MHDKEVSFMAMFDRRSVGFKTVNGKEACTTLEAFLMQGKAKEKKFQNRKR